MPRRRTLSSRLRPYLRLAAFGVVAISLTNCADSARFPAKDSENNVSSKPPAAIDSVTPSAPRPVYRSVVTQPLPTAPSRESTASVNRVYAPTTTSRIQRVDASPTRPAHPERVASKRARNDVHTVKPGETLNSISRREGLSVVMLARANNMTVHTKINVGDRILIPANGHKNLASLHTKSVNGPSRQVDTISPPPPATKQASAANSTQKVLVAIQEPQKTESVGKKPELAGAIPSFRWPVRGRIISSFGSTSNGTKNDGINVAVPEGTPVKAAEDGVVVYAGNGLKSYGNLVLVRHASGYISAYANASALLVKRGDSVTRGQVIARAGQTGNVNSPQLHFEIRQGKTPVDPAKFLNGA